MTELRVGTMKAFCLAVLTWACCALSDDEFTRSGVADDESVPVAVNEQVNQYALLVGVTEYDHLKESLWLKGPGNDMALMHNLLTEKFSVPEENITMLTHELGLENAELSPTRENIKREFSRLADIAGTNENATFVIMLGGHGSQQPDIGNDGEYDGYDEVFLPQDIAGWGGRQESPTIENAITDDELASWLAAITDEGAYVCAVIDACHSGTMTRDLNSDRERTRAIYWPTLTSPDAWVDVEHPTASLPAPLASRGSESTSSFLDSTDNEPRLVAIYAAQSTEPTVERLMPYGRYDIPDRNVHGLLTFTIDEVLRTASEPLSYRELMAEVQSRYDGWGRRGPTPAIEGPLDRVVFDATSVDRSSIRLTNEPDAPMSINQGGVHGLTAGTVLAVFPAATSEQSGEPLGHVAVTSCGTLDAEVEPVGYGGAPLVSSEAFPDGGRCEIVLVTYDDHLRMGVAIDDVVVHGTPVPAGEFDEIASGLHEMAERPGSWIRIVDAGADPEWVITWEDGQLQIVSTCVADQTDDAAPARPATTLGPPPAGATPVEWIESVLNRIVHVQNLRRIATLNGGVGLAGVPFEITIEPYDPDGAGDDDHAPADDGATRPRRMPGVLAIDMANPNDFPIDVTLLYIDANYGVSSLFPRQNEDSRLQPGDRFRNPFLLEITDDPVGVESLLAIAVRAEGQAVSFEMLARPSIAEAAGVRDAQRVVESPLGAFLRDATYQEVRDGAVTQPAQADYAMQLFTWEVLKAMPDAEGLRRDN